MAVLLTCHGSRPKDGLSEVDALGEQDDDDAISIAGGQVHTFAKTGLYRVKAKAAHLLRFGADPADATGGEDWDAGDIDVRWCVKGRKLAVDDPA